MTAPNPMFTDVMDRQQLRWESFAVGAAYTFRIFLPHLAPVLPFQRGRHSGSGYVHYAAMSDIDCSTPQITALVPFTFDIPYNTFIKGLDALSPAVKSPLKPERMEGKAMLLSFTKVSRQTITITSLCPMDCTEGEVAFAMESYGLAGQYWSKVSSQAERME